ncbi:multidrug resistance-associated ABC transporter [Agrocybe pediades]|nr:multidrug resistance-associated ABC transporter [Agrocybe pediades]
MLLFLIVDVDCVINFQAMQLPLSLLSPIPKVPDADHVTTFLIPVLVVLLCIFTHIVHSVISLFKSAIITTSDPVNEHEDMDWTRAPYLKQCIENAGGQYPFYFVVGRLLGCLVLLGISIYDMFVSSGIRLSIPPGLPHILPTRPEAYMLLTYLYCTILAVMSVVSIRWSVLATRYNVITLLSVFGVYAFRDLWPLATTTQRPIDALEGKLIWLKIFVLFFTAVVIPTAAPRRHTPIPSHDKNVKPEPSDEQTCSWFSFLTYSFLDPVILKGYRVAHLKYDELPPQADYDRAEYLSDGAFPYLDPLRSGKRRHVFFGLMRVFRWEYITLAWMLCLHAVSEFLAPFGINRLLNYLETAGQGATIRPWFWVLCIFCGPLLRILVLQFYIYITTRTTVRTEGIITQLIFEHSLRIRLKADSEATGNDSQGNLSGAVASVTHADLRERTKTVPNSNLFGKINNLVTSDLQNITEGRDFLVLFLFWPLQLTLATAYLYKILGWSCFAGLLTMILLFPIPGYVAKILQRAQKTRMEQTDERVQDITEAISVLRMIKLFGWEERVAQRIAQKREAELISLWRTKVLSLINGTIGFLIPLVSMAATYGFYTGVMKEELSAAKIFSSMPVFNMIRLQLMTIAPLITLLVQAKVSLDRVDQFLNQTELLDSYSASGRRDVSPVLSSTGNSNLIGFNNATFTWSEGSAYGIATPSRRSYRLNIVGELTFRKGCINLIIGPTGAGKTSLIMALLGEMHFIPTAVDSWFNLPRSGGIAYASQESWVQNETVRQNILFGTPYDESRYRQVLRQCALERDLELFEAGDATEVGEKGLTLSGGQKARITLARAIYSRADIILLDDILAALDVHTSAWIINECLQGDLVKGRTVLLVTHNVALASPVANFIVSVGADGSVTSYTPDRTNLIFAVDENLLNEEGIPNEPFEGKGQQGSSLDDKIKVDGKLIALEEIAEGHVTWRSIQLFLSSLSGGHPFIFFGIWMSSIFITDWMNTAQVWFLGYWGSQYTDHGPATVNVSFYLAVYFALMGSTFFYCGGQLLYIRGTMRASRVINSTLVDSMLRSTLRWLDETPVGRIIARCTQDMRAVDGVIPQKYSDITELVISILCKVAIIVAFSPFFFFPSLGVTFIGLYIANMYLKAQMSVKREMSNARSPLLSHFSAAVSGIVSIRAYGAEAAFKAVSLERIDHYIRIARVSNNLNRWIGMRIDLLGNAFTTSLAAYCFYTRSLSATNIGFTLNLATSFCTMLLMLVRSYNEFEVQANSLERIQGFIDIEHEPPPTEEGKPPAAWPTSGDLRVEHLSARYSKSGPKVLHDISFHIESGQRVGIVGRTGSGKSSLSLALLRCIITEGTMHYDGISTHDINLDALRSSITIIPQTPELLSGTIRRNLDPFEQHDDAVLNEALRAAGLFTLQEQLGEGRLTLDSSIASGGNNLSVGQKQILALARAMVRGSKLLILDEATSAIDYTTDSVIQDTLRHQLPPDVTVITVAHRLHTIMDADKIMVLDRGKIVEFDSPAVLLEKEHGMLRALVDGSGDKATLFAIAKEGRHRGFSPSELGSANA